MSARTCVQLGPSLTLQGAAAACVDCIVIGRTDLSRGPSRCPEHHDRHSERVAYRGWFDSGDVGG